tara:strand:- start:2443 stop:2874 length:432 start_codon:yes stop_codon:yes gene_type:complete
MLKKLILLILFTSLSAYTHSVKDGDMEGSWQIVEAYINGEKVENANGRMVASEGFASVNWTDSDGTKYFNYTSYEVKDGMVYVETLNHALDKYIGAKWSHKPNFMGDKKSYITTWSWDGVEYTNRWEKVSCKYEKCARITDFN